MKKVKTLAVALLLCLCPICHAQQYHVVDKELQSVLSNNSGERLSVNIILKSQTEPARMKALAARAKDNKTAKVLVTNELK